MKKTYHLLSLCMMALMAVVSSCSLENEVDNLSNDLLRVANVNTEGVVVVAGDASEATLEVKANSAWVVTCDDPSLTLLTTAGSGDGQARVRVGENPSALNSRSWVVKLRSLADANAIERAITVTQSPNNGAINIIVGETMVSFQPHVLTLMVESNGKWIASLTGTTGDYAKLRTTGEQNGNGIIEIEMAKNDTEQKRPFTVTVTSTTDPRVSKNITLQQMEFGFYINLVGNKTIELSNIYDPEGRVVQFLTNKNWTAVADQPWVTVSPATGTVVTNGEDAERYVVITAATNTSLQSREANVVFTVYNTNNTVADRDTLHVLQLNSVGLDVIAPSQTTLSSQEQTVTLQVVSDMHWRATLTGTAGVATLRNAEGSASGIIEIDVTENTSNTSRDFTVNVSNDDNSIVRSVRFTQSGSNYYVNILGNKAISMPRVASTAKVTIAVNQNWEAQTSDEWLSVEPFFGNVASVGTRETQDVTVSVVANNRAETRRGNIVFTVRNSDGSVAYSETLTVTQGSMNAPRVELPEVFDITTSSAFVSSNYQGASEQGVITEYGFYWGTSPTNLTGQNKIPFTPTTYGYEGRVETLLNNLQPLTTYYVVAYAINDQGIGLSEVRQFTTAGATPGEDDNQTPGL